jgi:hypothetical protein
MSCPCFRASRASKLSGGLYCVAIGARREGLRKDQTFPRRGGGLPVASLCFSTSIQLLTAETPAARKELLAKRTDVSVCRLRDTRLITGLMSQRMRARGSAKEAPRRQGAPAPSRRASLDVPLPRLRRAHDLALVARSLTSVPKVTCEWLAWLVYQKFWPLTPLDRIRCDRAGRGVPLAISTLMTCQREHRGCRSMRSSRTGARSSYTEHRCGCT